MLNLPQKSTRAYTVLMCFLAIAMPNNNFMMSLAMILLFILWLFSPGVVAGFAQFKKNKPAVLLAGLFILHIIWLFNTSDFEYAFKDLRIKLPLLVVAVVLGSIPISRSQVKLIFLALSLGVWYATITGYMRYIALPEGMYDYRDIVKGISHIRLGLMMVMLFMGILFFIKELPIIWKLYAVLVLVNILLFFNVAQMATGSIILLITLVAAVFFVIKAGHKPVVFIGAVVLVLGLLGGSVYYAISYYNDYFVSTNEVPSPDEKTALGNSYITPSENLLVENGNRHFDYYNDVEMVKAWNERSNIKMVTDTGSRALNYALIRYLTSKGLRKDYEGVMALTNRDIKNIEQGYPSEIYAHESGLKLRFHSFLFGIHVYKATGTVSGSSFMQRILYWQVCMEVIKNNWILGTGTGDIKDEITNMHQAMHPELSKEYWLRAHNQFLSFFATFGIVGFGYFIFLFGYTFYHRRKSFLAIVFLTIAFFSCLSEDTIETQAGVTFFAFFFVLFSMPFAERLSATKNENNRN